MIWQPLPQDCPRETPAIVAVVERPCAAGPMPASAEQTAIGCQRCGSWRVVRVAAEVMAVAVGVGLMVKNELPPFLQGGGGTLGFRVCSDCGQLQGEFPAAMVARTAAELH